MYILHNQNYSYTCLWLFKCNRNQL